MCLTVQAETQCLLLKEVVLQVFCSHSRIFLNLPSQKYGSNFWTILLIHLTYFLHAVKCDTQQT